MNIEELAVKLAEIGVNQGAYRIGNYGRGGSDSIVLLPIEDGYGVFYSERGHNSLLASFKSESEACDYVWDQLRNDEAALAHNIGIFDSEAQARELAAKLADAGIRVKTDVIPMTANSKRYRIFVFGRDIDRVREVRGW